jgi:hypothetical protein
MNRSVWKFPLFVVGSQEIDMPEGADIVSAQLQNGVPTLWALVDPAEEFEKRIFEIYGTGHPIAGEDKEFLVFVGTVQQGSLVWHIFERNIPGRGHCL